MVDEFRARRDLMVEGLRSIPGWECNVPQGAFYVFADVSALYAAVGEGNLGAQTVVRKVIELARALCSEPKLILLDEPSAGLDPVIATVVDELIISLSEKSKVTCVIVTHEMDSAFRIATRMAMLYHGKIIEEGTPEEMKKSRNPVVSQFLTGSTEGPILEETKDAITT
mgnify:CR=1 FL=1